MVRKIGEHDKLVGKTKVLRETTFGSSYRDVHKNEEDSTVGLLILLIFLNKTERLLLILILILSHLKLPKIASNLPKIAMFFLPILLNSPKVALNRPKSP